MTNDIRHALRGLRREPAFTVVAVLTLALGMGATIAVFSLMRAVYLDRLPFEAPQRLVAIFERRATSGATRKPVSGHEFDAWTKQAGVFAHMALMQHERLNLTGRGEPEILDVLRVSSEYFPVLGLQPAVGRAFAVGEDQAGPGRVAVLSDRLWRRRFAGNPAVIGQTVLLDGERIAVVGVMPPLPSSLSPDIWLPIDVPAQVRAVGRHNLDVIARLKDGATITQAQAALDAASARLAREFPQNAGHGATVAPLREDLVGEFRPAFLALAAAGMSVATGILAGLGPAWRCSFVRPGSMDGGRASDPPGRRRLRSALVACEVALTLILLVGAGLMLNSFARLIAVDPGFATRGVLVLPIDLPGARYPEAPQRRAFYDRVLETARAIPGVESAGAVSHLPLGGADNWMMFSIVGQPPRPPGQELSAAFRVATPDYFRALDIPLERGRFFADADARPSVPIIRWYPQQPSPAGLDEPQAPPVAIVSATAARQFWPGEDPIGKRIHVLFSPEVTIVGVVGDIRHNALGAQYGEILRLVIVQGMQPVVLGIAAGVAGAFGVTRFVEALLYGVPPADPLTFATASLALFVVTLLACWLPARRAARRDPLVALRTD